MRKYFLIIQILVLITLTACNANLLVNTTTIDNLEIIDYSNLVEYKNEYFQLIVKGHSPKDYIELINSI